MPLPGEPVTDPFAARQAEVEGMKAEAGLSTVGAANEPVPFELYPITSTTGLAALPALPAKPDLVATLHLAKHKLKCPKCDKVQTTKNEKCTECGHDMKQARKAKFANMGQPHMATVSQELRLAPESKDGLVWKAICKTGTLALSPGPGQVDVEKPLDLTPDLFASVKTGFDEKAIEHVTIPETHGNGVLENTGVVRNLEVRSSNDPDDPAGTQVLWAGMDFTEPDVRAKAERGSILNTSVGLKFNYRRKRDGKHFPVVLEHVALTNQPWVDGLAPFGSGTLTASQQPYNREHEVPWDGVFVQPPDAQRRRGILRPKPRSGVLPSTMPQPKRQTGQSLEEILASQQAQIEVERQKREQVEKELQLARGTINAQGQQLHSENVDTRIRELQQAGLPPAVLVRARDIMLADYRPDNEAGLNLSVTTGEEQVDFQSATDVIEYLLSAIPQGPGAAASYAAAVTEAMDLSAKEPQGKSAGEKADEIEQRLHPDRFNADGTRKAAA